MPVLETPDGVRSVGQPWSPDISEVPQSTIVALAGPITKEEAAVLHESWTVSPAQLAQRARFSRHPPSSSSATTMPAASTALNVAAKPVDIEVTEECRALHEAQRCDAGKGCEQYGRVLAIRYGTCWEEYWPFLGCL